MDIIFIANPFAGPNSLVPLVMVAWLPIVVYIFQRFSAQRAVVISFIAAWLFLPEAAIQLPGLPDYTKITATCFGILLATFIFDASRFRSFKFGWVDVPMLIWCLCPMASSLSNGLGLYDGFSSTVDQIATWGLPYFLGRLYLNNLVGLRRLAVGIFVGGLVYVPFCLFEIRMSPQLHAIVYGAHAHSDFLQSIRYGGYRPSVFMRHGLAVGAWMMVATLVGIWLWRSGELKRLWNIPVQWLVAALLVTFVLSKSTGAYALLVIGIGMIAVCTLLRSGIPLVLIVLSIGVYLYINAETETYFTDQLIHLLSGVFDADRVSSLEFRFNNEEVLSDHARLKPIFGWAGWGRSIVENPETGRDAIQDSLWIIAFGQYGTVGLASWVTAMLLPVIHLVTSRYRGSLWSRKELVPVAVLAVALTVYVIDCLLNAMVNPIYILICGGLSSFAVGAGQAVRKRSLPKTAVRSRTVPVSQPR